MRGVRALAVSLALLVGEPSALPDVQEPACTTCTAGEIACPSCSGSGRQAIECTVCEGTGASSCPACGREPKKGWLACTNPVCHDGKMKWQGGDDDPCKLCKASGRLRCEICRKDERRACSLCTRGKVEVLCRTCTGKGRIACPSCRVSPTAAICPDCSDQRDRACPTCADGSATRTCGRCLGTGSMVCTQCRGVQRTACAPCGAAGKVRYGEQKLGITAGKAGVRGCDACEEKGVVDCDKCEGGSVTCSLCKGSRALQGCASCQGWRQIACENCLSGGYARAEMYGDLLAVAGRPDAALAYYDAALRNAGSMTGPLLDADVSAIIEAQRKAEIQMAELSAALGRRLPQRDMLPEMLPLDVLRRFWSGGTPEDARVPWRDDRWLERHRSAVVKGLEAKRNAVRKASAAGK